LRSCTDQLLVTTSILARIATSTSRTQLPERDDERKSARETRLARATRREWRRDEEECATLWERERERQEEWKHFQRADWRAGTTEKLCAWLRTTIIADTTAPPPPPEICLCVYLSIQRSTVYHPFRISIQRSPVHHPLALSIQWLPVHHSLSLSLSLSLSNGHKCIIHSFSISNGSLVASSISLSNGHQCTIHSHPL
jgi:hypothetical protein